jgi:predicted DNA-binding WGR domain protein
MSNVVNVNAITVYEMDHDANIDKFYTTYSLGPFEIRQWGRVGVIGQFSIERHSSEHAAITSARGQVNAKERKGYTSPPGRQEVTFQFDLDKLGSNPGKDQAKWVAHAKIAFERSAPSTIATQQQPAFGPRTTTKTKTVEIDKFDDFTNRALQAITLAVTDPAKAGVTYASLNEEWIELEAVTEKAKSYLSTLDQLVSASMS